MEEASEETTPWDEASEIDDAPLSVELPSVEEGADDVSEETPGSEDKAEDTEGVPDETPELLPSPPQAVKKSNTAAASRNNNSFFK